MEYTPYYDHSNVKVNSFKGKTPFTGQVVSQKRIVGPKATGETCHIIINHDGDFPYIEGQSWGVIPPGHAREGRQGSRRAPVLHRLLPVRGLQDGRHGQPVRAARHLLGPRPPGRRPGQEGHLLQLPLRHAARL